MTPDDSEPADRQVPDGQPADRSDPTDRVAAFTTVDGGVVVYDRDQPTAWISSTTAIPVAETG